MRKLNTFLTTVLIYASVLLPLQAKTNVPVAKTPEKMSYRQLSETRAIQLLHPAR